jgi:hypothetical protein
MSNRLHIVAACSNRKRHAPVAFLGRIAGATVNARAKLWWRTLSELNSKIECASLLPASQLYAGNYWSIVRQLPAEARKQKLQPSLWIISAGYGLVSGDDRLLPYSATFTRGDADSVLNGKLHDHDAKEWWSELTELDLPDSESPRSLERLLSDFRSDRFLIIASSEYVSAVQSDLIRGQHFLRNRDNLVLISSRTNSLDERIRPNLIITDARLLCNSTCPPNCTFHVLRKGVRGSIGAALARYFICSLSSGRFSAAEFKRQVEAALIKVPELFSHKRSSMTNSDVKKFIKTELDVDLNASATRLLKKLRESGKACEQKRFKQLFGEVNKARHES